MDGDGSFVGFVAGGGGGGSFIVAGGGGGGGACSFAGIASLFEGATGSTTEIALTGDFFTGVSMSDISPKILYNCWARRSLSGVSGTGDAGLSFGFDSFFDGNSSALLPGSVDVDATGGGNSFFADFIAVVLLFDFDCALVFVVLEAAVFASFCVFVLRVPIFRSGSGSICFVVFTDGDRLLSELHLSSRISIRFSVEGTAGVGGVGNGGSLATFFILMVSLAR